MTGNRQGSQGKKAAGALEARPAADGAGATPGGLAARAQSVFQAHPRLATWLVLAIGMVAILLWASRDVDLLAYQRLVLVLATVGLAGLCAWIINWE